MWGKGERQTFSLKIKPKKNGVCFRWIVTWIHLLCILYEKERTSSPYSVDSTWFLYEHCVFEWFCAKNCARGIVGKTSRTTTTIKKKWKKSIEKAIIETRAFVCPRRYCSGSKEVASKIIFATFCWSATSLIAWQAIIW